MYDIGIIGGGTAGLTAAIYGQRAGKKTIVFEGTNFGGQIASSPEVENYPGIAKISGAGTFDEIDGAGGKSRSGDSNGAGDRRA